MSNIINDKVVEYINNYYYGYDQELQMMRLKAEAAGVPIILRDTEMLLLSLIQIHKPKEILEIGAAVGYSASVFSKFARVTTIERDDEMYEKLIENVEENTMIRPVHAEATDVLEMLAQTDEKFDFAFIDAGKSHYKEFFEGCLKLMNPGGVIVCDNVLFHGRTVSDEYDPNGKYKTNIKKMREFVDWVMDERACDTSLLAVGDGVTISVIR